MFLFNIYFQEDLKFGYLCGILKLRGERNVPQQEASKDSESY